MQRLRQRGLCASPNASSTIVLLYCYIVLLYWCPKGLKSENLYSFVFRWASHFSKKFLLRTRFFLTARFLTRTKMAKRTFVLLGPFFIFRHIWAKIFGSIIKQSEWKSWRISKKKWKKKLRPFVTIKNGHDNMITGYNFYKWRHKCLQILKLTKNMLGLNLCCI